MKLSNLHIMFNTIDILSTYLMYVIIRNCPDHIIDKKADNSPSLQMVLTTQAPASRL